MKNIIVAIAALVIAGLTITCNYDPSSMDEIVLLAGLQCQAGQMRCNGNLAEMCDASRKFILFQNCGSIGQTCYYNNPARCGGFYDIACCD